MTRQYLGDEEADHLEVERAVKGPRGTKVFGRDWLYNLNPSEYRNYLCRAFTYCEIKDRFRAQPVLMRFTFRMKTFEKQSWVSWKK